ncbi:zinc finger, C2H2 type [Cooperia oncophora]
MLSNRAPKRITVATSLPADNFASLLVAKFTKRISLPISACMELLSGNLFLKRFMFCTFCNTIVTTPLGIEAHNKSKCGVEGLVSLYCPPAPVNSQIECPLCSTKLCSISAMRGHMAIQHGVYVEYKSVTQTTACVSESNASLQELASRYPDTRSAVARETDSALWLRFGLLQPKTQFDMQLKLAMKGIRVSGADRKDGQASGGSTQSTPRNIQRDSIQVPDDHVIPAIEVVSLFKSRHKNPKEDQRSSSQPQTPTSNQNLTQHYIKPFVLVNNMLRCKFCAHQTSTPQAMRDHLQSNHVLVCRACGNGFAHREALTRHGKMGRCSMFFKDASVKHISADCGVCKKRMSLANAYLHLFREHLSSVVYGTVSGQVYPEHQNLHIDASLGEATNVVKDSVIYSPSIDQQHSKERSSRDVVVYKRPTHVVCSCYLCGMEMVSLEQLQRHLSKHTEKWTRCPFCYDYVPIPSHEVMKAHLMERHMQKRDGSWTCRYCQRMLVRGSYAHLLYMWHPKREIVPYVVPMFRLWYDILSCRGFLGASVSFILYAAEMQLWLCISVFSSRTAFLLHFGMHMDEPNMTCKLCKFRFASRVALQNHRLSHAILINSSNGRQLVILDTKLVVPEHLDDKRVKRVKEVEPLSEEKRFNMDIAMTMRHLVRSVCEQLGESYDTAKESSPQLDAAALDVPDDDIIEIDSPKVDDDLVESVDTTQAALSAEVRVEAADGVVDAGSGMPGYVEDDEDDAIECITAEKSKNASASAAVVIPVEDETADEDLKVVAEVEYAPGSSGTAAPCAREKKFKCSKCSSSFITSYALRTHEMSAHSTDAGGICDKVFGVPVRGFFFICRNCCAAFESQQLFKVHRLSHGPTGSVSCGECSAILSNTRALRAYRQSAMLQTARIEGCFMDDARLMYHLREAHGVSLFFFCKACHLGGTHERTIYAHVAVKSQRCRQFGAQKNWPKSIAAHEFSLERSGLESRDPIGMCTSFVPSTNRFANNLQGLLLHAASFTAAETFRNGGVVKELAMTLDNSLEFPFKGIYDQTPVEGTSTAPGRALIPRPPEIQTIPSSAMNNIRTPRTHSRTAPLPPHPLPVGARIAAVAPLMSNQTSTLPVKRRPGPSSDIITLSDDEPGPSAAKRAAPSSLPVAPSPLTLKKPTDSANRCKKWFCLDCASGQMDEVEAMKHYFGTHVKVAEQKAAEKGLLFRPLHYELQCPFPKCREPLSTLTNLRIHINNKHRSETSYSSAVNGVEGTCCPLCGTLNQWNIQMPGTSYTMSHIAVHGLRRYHMCRDCFVCFKGDYDCVRMKTHFETTHCTPIPRTNNRELLCKLCREVILKSHLAEHVIEKHLVTGFKSRDPKNQGKLIVKTGAVTRRFLGFERIYHVGDDSDMD